MQIVTNFDHHHTCAQPYFQVFSFLFIFYLLLSFNLVNQEKELQSTLHTETKTLVDCDY